jgi:Iodothyronine deiodinase
VLKGPPAVDWNFGPRYCAKSLKAGEFVSWWKWTAAVLVVVLACVYGALSYMMGGPRDVYGFLRYALPQWRNGDLHVGDPAPNVRLLALDGHSTFHLSDRIGQRPLVLVFGSYT